MKTIPLTQGYVAIVDDADFSRVSEHKWCLARRGHLFYAARAARKPCGKKTLQYLHRFLFPGVSRIDHRDGDGLNNLRRNLRPVTHQQNLRAFQNKRRGASSRFRGVSWYRRDQNWEANIDYAGRKVYLGRFSDENLAARAYDSAAVKFFGEFASPNFPV